MYPIICGIGFDTVYSALQNMFFYQKQALHILQTHNDLSVLDSEDKFGFYDHKNYFSFK